MTPAATNPVQVFHVTPGRLFALFAYLQVLDLLTTSAFLISGVQEANPLVVLAMAHAPTPALGLLVVKLCAIALGVYCWVTGRARLLRSVNLFYAVLVAYNLVCLILGLAVQGGSR